MPAALPDPHPTDRATRWLRALAFWTLIVLIFTVRGETVNGEALDWGQSFRRWAAAWYLWALLAPLIAWIDRQLPVDRDALVRRLLLHVPLSLAFTVAHLYLHYASSRLLRFPFEPAPFDHPPSSLVSPPYFLVYWAIVGAYVLFDNQSHVKHRELRTAELERLLAESRLDTLRTQLHPHFLFNALNAISASVEHDPRTARWMLDELGTLLRSSLEHAREQEIPLHRELEFIASYLALQKVRFDDRLDVTSTVGEGLRDALVPALILQPLIENAIRHGIALRSTGGRIGMAIWREEMQLRLRVRDNGPGLPPAWDPDRDLGIGLSNTRERLRQLYGGAQSFTIRSAPEGGVEVDIALPYRESPPAVIEDRRGRREQRGEGAGLTAAAGASARAQSDTRGS